MTKPKPEMPTDDHIWKMLDAWYQLTGRRIAPTQDERDRDFAAMKHHLQSFEAATPARQAGEFTLESRTNPRTDDMRRANPLINPQVFRRD